MIDTWDKTRATIETLVQEAQFASCLADRIIAVSKLGAACTLYIGDMQASQADLGQLCSQATASAKKERPIEPSKPVAGIGQGTLF